MHIAWNTGPARHSLTGVKSDLSYLEGEQIKISLHIKKLLPQGNAAKLTRVSPSASHYKIIQLQICSPFLFPSFFFFWQTFFWHFHHIDGTGALRKISETPKAFSSTERKSSRQLAGR